MIFKGTNGQVELTATGIVITRKGIFAVLDQGFSGERSIPYGSITAIQLKKPVFLGQGYIRFSVLGTQEVLGNIAVMKRDENTVVFNVGQTGQAIELKQRIETAMLGNQASSRLNIGSTTAPLVVADELKKLADLRDRGILTDQEFQSQKQKVLNSS